MIRFDPRNIDVHGTERVFKKVINPSNNSIRLVDKDGIPLRAPTSAMLSRLHSSFVLSPRGVPIRKSNHAYSGQLTQGKMQNTVHGVDPNQQLAQEMVSYNSMHTYGMNSAASSRHYMQSNMSASKKRTFGSGPPRAVTMAKSASTQHTQYLAATPPESIGLDPDEADNWNGSQQGKRLEKEWSALSQCRALKRSSEIVSHRIDRMYFMTGNKLSLSHKYHVEDDELMKLKDMAQARATSRTSRSSRSRKGDIFRPEGSAYSTKTVTSEDCRSEPDSQSEQINGKDKPNVKQNGDPGVNIMVSQKALTPKPQGIRKSPLEGWASGTPSEKEAQELDDEKSINSIQDDSEVLNCDHDTNNAIKRETDDLSDVDSTADNVTEPHANKPADIISNNGSDKLASDNENDDIKAGSKGGMGND